jgi:hypothetical protein
MPHIAFANLMRLLSETQHPYAIAFKAMSASLAVSESLLYGLGLRMNVPVCFHVRRLAWTLFVFMKPSPYNGLYWVEFLWYYSLESFIGGTLVPALKVSAAFSGGR